jgi:hypothetical protein
MQSGKPRGQLGVMIGGGQEIVYQGDGADTNRNGRPTLHAEIENILRRIELLDGNDRNRIAGENRGIGTVAIEQTGCVDAQPEPDGEGGKHEVTRLGEHPGEDDRPRDTNDGCCQPEYGFLQHAPAAGFGENGDAERRRRRRFKLEPEARGKGHDEGNPDPDRKEPGLRGNAGKGERLVDRPAGHVQPPNRT